MEKILVVDDEKSLRGYEHRAQAMGYEVPADGEQAIGGQ